MGKKLVLFFLSLIIVVCFLLGIGVLIVLDSQGYQPPVKTNNLPVVEVIVDDAIVGNAKIESNADTLADKNKVIDLENVGKMDSSSVSKIIFDKDESSNSIIKDDNEPESNKIVLEENNVVDSNGNYVDEIFVDDTDYSQKNVYGGVVQNPDFVKEDVEDNVADQLENSFFWRSFSSADDLLDSCPTDEEIAQIEEDFNFVWWDYPGKWKCTENGKESFKKLTIYNTFRLMHDIPLEKHMPWANNDELNLYNWFESLDLLMIRMFESESNDSYSYASGETINIKMNDFEKERYRLVVDHKSGVGIGDVLVLFVHESRHTIAGGNKPHTCAGSKDLTFEEQGAWNVQYEMLMLMADETGNYFTAKQQQSFRDFAKQIRDNRFCE